MGSLLNSLWMADWYGDPFFLFSRSSGAWVLLSQILTDICFNHAGHFKLTCRQTFTCTVQFSHRLSHCPCYGSLKQARTSIPTLQKPAILRQEKQRSSLRHKGRIAALRFDEERTWHPHVLAHS